MSGQRRRKSNQSRLSSAARLNPTGRSRMFSAGAKSGFRTMFHAIGVLIPSAVGSFPMTTAGIGRRVNPKRRGVGLYSTMGAGRSSTILAGLGYLAANGVRPGSIGVAARATSVGRRCHPTKSSSTCATSRNTGFSSSRLIFSRPILHVFIEPEPAFFSETVVVNETFVLRDRGFAVNPGIEPSFVAAAIGRPVPEFQVRPHVLAGTAAALPGAMQVSAQDLRRTDFRQSLVQQTNIRETNNTIRPAASVPRPQPLSRNERGRLGQTPPRAASGVTQQPPQQPGMTGAAPGQQPRGVTGAQQPRQPERGAAGAPPEQQRGLRERGATGPTPPEQQRRLYNRAPSGPTPEERTPRARSAIPPAPEQQRGVQERGLQQRGLQERGATAPR